MVSSRHTEKPEGCNTKCKEREAEEHHEATDMTESKDYPEMHPSAQPSQLIPCGLEVNHLL